MSGFLRMSNLFAPTLKEAPAEAELKSHILLLRAAMIQKAAAGIYTFLPLGYRVLSKVERIIEEELDATGAQEILMPALQPAELWHESGRWDDYGPELMRLTDRHDRGFCLGPTHEELITAVVRNNLRSYRQLPCALYQVQVKFRDEIRPRFGLLRSREFIMKDCYSFHATQESLQEYYDRCGEAYQRICERCGLKAVPVDADSGQIGGKVSTEYMALADAGEAEIVYCDCGFAADVEAAQVKIDVREDASKSLELIETPGAHTIADLAAFLHVPENATVKALALKDDTGKIFVFFVPGDHELNELKGDRIARDFEMLTDDEMIEAGLVKGFMGPVGLPEGITVVADESLRASNSWLIGANKPGYHYRGAKQGVDFKVDIWADLCSAKAGDLCPVCGKPLQSARGIEVSQIFQLGTKYSTTMGATFADEDGVDKPFIMGCYGVGVTRTMAAVIEQHNDEHGIIWPVSICPAEVCVIPLSLDDTVFPVASKLCSDLVGDGIEVCLDDRDERAGVKFNDADLIGWPYQITVGKRGVASHIVELKTRATGEKRDIPMDEAASVITGIVREARAAYAH